MSSEAQWVWRHPKPDDAAGRCIGAGTDLRVDRRRTKRLARRIQQVARRQQRAHHVVTSPLRRCADVGRWLRRWGWRHEIDASLRELDFGAWEGRAWAAIGKGEIDAWVADFATYSPGGGEALMALLARATAFGTGAPFIVSHGGWMLARRWSADHAGAMPDAAQWPAPPRYGECWRFTARQ